MQTLLLMTNNTEHVQLSCHHYEDLWSNFSSPSQVYLFTTLETFEDLLVKFEKYSIDHSIIVFYDFDWTGNVVI